MKSNYRIQMIAQNKRGKNLKNKISNETFKPNFIKTR